MTERRQPRFSKEQCRTAVLGFCGAMEKPLLYYLNFQAQIENEAALNSEEAPENLTTEDLVDFQTAIMKWLDNDDDP